MPKFLVFHPDLLAQANNPQEGWNLVTTPWSQNPLLRSCLWLVWVPDNAWRGQSWKFWGCFRGFFVCQIIFSFHGTPIWRPSLLRQFPYDHFPVWFVLCWLYLNYFTFLTFQHWWLISFLCPRRILALMRSEKEEQGGSCVLSISFEANTPFIYPIMSKLFLWSEKKKF